MPPLPLPPNGNFWVSDLLRASLAYSWGEIAKAGRLTAKPGLCVEARRINGVTPLRAAEAA